MLPMLNDANLPRFHPTPRRHCTIPSSSPAFDALLLTRRLIFIESALAILFLGLGLHLVPVLALLVIACIVLASFRTSLLVKL